MSQTEIIKSSDWLHYVTLVAEAEIGMKAFLVPRSDPKQLQFPSQLYKWDVSRLDIRGQQRENKQWESLQ